MSPNKKPLGRGLSNLLAKAGDGVPVVRDHSNYNEIPLAQIQPNPKQPRKYFSQKEIEELAATLHTVGLIEPVVVRRINENSYQLIAGERRFRAAKLVGFKKIPAVIKQVNDIQAIELGIIENIQREDLNPVEEARAYEYWMKVTKQKADVLAKKLGKGRSTVLNLTRMLKLPEEVLNLIEKKQLNVGQARPLLSINDPRQLKQLASKIAQEGWTSRRVEDEIAHIIERRKLHSLPKKKEANVAYLERELRSYFTARVQIQHNQSGSGKISIQYGNLKDLDRLLAIIGVRKS